MSEHLLPEWIFVPELEESIVEAETLEDFLSSNTVLLNVLNNIQEGISILTPELKVVYLNKPMRRWYQQPEITKLQKCYRLFHERRHPCENCPTLSCIEQNQPCSGEVAFAAAEGGAVRGKMHVHSSPVHNTRGEIVLILEYVQNISAQGYLRDSVVDLQDQISVLEAQNKLLIQSLTLREKQYQDLERTIQENMDQYVRPALEYLKKRVDEKDYELVTSILENSIYPIIVKKQSPVSALTSRELQVANLIKDGYSSKEIADELFITKKAVDFHRANIRKKLDLDGKTNLQVYLEMHL